MLPAARIQASDPETGAAEKVGISISYAGQHIDLDIAMLGSGTFIGRALAPDGVTPLPGAVVRVRSIVRPLYGERGAVADATGTFVVSDVPVGAFAIDAVDTRTVATAKATGFLAVAGGTTVQDLVLVPLGAPEQPRGSVRGQVFRSDGQTPASGVPIYTTSGGFATTDASGFYRIEGLSVGSITVQAVDLGRNEEARASLSIIEGTEVTANLVLFGGTGRVSGVVRSADGTPVAGAEVGGGFTLVTTDANGAFLLPDVPLGDREISAVDRVRNLGGKARVQLVRPGEQVAVDVVLEGRASLFGTVYEADGVTPVPSLRVYLFGPGSTALTTNAAGAWSAPNLSLGHYSLSAFRTDFSDGNVRDIDLRFPNEFVRADVRFRGTGRVTGMVRNSSGNELGGAAVGLSEVVVVKGVLASPQNPDCLPGVEVGGTELSLPPCTKVGVGFEYIRTARQLFTPPASGAFSFENVYVGSLGIEVGDRFTGDRIGAGGTIAAAGDVEDFQLRFEDTARTITGTVFLPDGVTLAPPGVLVLLKIFGADREARTDAQGRFLFQFPLVLGGFRLEASDPTTGFVGQAYGTVDRGGDVDVPIRLLGRGDVTVEVIGATGSIVPGATVSLRRATFPGEEKSGTAGPDGRVIFAGGDGVTEGPYRVEALAPSGGARGAAVGTVPTPGGPSFVQVELPNAAGTVHGVFFQVDGTTPIPSAQVHIRSARGENFTTTDASGVFSFQGVPLGGFSLDAFDPASARRAAGTGQVSADAQVVTADLVAQAIGTVTGVVTLSRGNTPVAGASVKLVDSEGFFSKQLQATSGPDGVFRFPGVAAGEFPGGSGRRRGPRGIGNGSVDDGGRGGDGKCRPPSPAGRPHRGSRKGCSWQRFHARTGPRADPAQPRNSRRDPKHDRR